MEDFLGQEIEEGDIIYCVCTGRAPDFMLARVKELTPKSMIIDPIKTTRMSNYDTLRKFKGEHCVVINDIPKAREMMEELSDAI